MLTNLQRVSLFQRHEWVVKIGLFLSLVMMCYSPKLWLTTKAIPVFPLYNWIPIPQKPWDYIFAITFFILQLWYLLKSNRWVGWSIIILAIYLGLIDQHRMNPYHYQPLMLLFVSLVYYDSRDQKKALIALGWIFIATYSWSGIHKNNPYFFEVFSRLFTYHLSFLPESLCKFLAHTLPYIEAGFGLSLLFNKTRKAGVICLTLMHLMIIIAVPFFKVSYNIMPWNSLNALSVCVIFWNLNTDGLVSFFDVLYDRKK